MSNLMLPPPPDTVAVIRTVSETFSHHSRIDAANIRIMIAAIVVLFSVVLFILGLHLYAKWFWRSAQSHPLQDLHYETDEPFEAQQTTGLEKAVIETLPIFTYAGEFMTKGAECAVCLSEFEEKEHGRFLPKCNHMFHTECIDMWLKSHSTCPLCRLNIFQASTLATEIGDFSTLEDVLLSEDRSRPSQMIDTATAPQQIHGTSSCNQHEGFPPYSATESKASNKSDGQLSALLDSQQEGSTAPRHLAIELPRLPSGAIRAISSSGTDQTFCSNALCPKSPLRGLSLRQILSRDKKLTFSTSTSATCEEEAFPASLQCNPVAV